MAGSNRFHVRTMTVVALFFLWALSCVFSAEAKKTREAETPSWDSRQARLAAVTGEVLANTEIEENLRVLCDDIGGRVTGTEGGRNARAFVGRLFNRYRLSNVHEESFEMFGWERGPFACEFTKPHRKPLHAVALANTPSTSGGGLEAEVVDIGYGNPAEVEPLGSALEGKFVLAVSGAMPGGRWMHRSEVMAVAARSDAAGLLYQTTQPGNLPMTGMCWLDGTSPIPGVGISKEDGDWIKRQLGRGRGVRVKLEMTNLTGRVTSANVIGEIPGRSREYVLVGAHLDAWDLGQGAVDNGTGTVVIIEAARAIAQLGIQPEATIRFVLFMGEEAGLCGSRAYAAAHNGELADCRAMINCDMEGRPLGVRVMGHEGSHQFFEELLASMKGIELEQGVSHRVGIYGDHRPFLLAGVPVITPVSRIENEGWRYYHTSADTYDKVTFEQLNIDAAFVAALALELAVAQERILPQLDEEGVAELIREHGLEEALAFWGDWPHGK
jgi:Iap family predicted aminopeptidase